MGSKLPRPAVGQRFGRLRVFIPAGRYKGRPAALCICDCGTLKGARIGDLWSGGVRSCGCLNQERILKLNGGKRLSCGLPSKDIPEYRIWMLMIQRCTNPKASGFDRYGAKGVEVCPRWRHSFDAFYEDMGPRPEGRFPSGYSRYSIDRRDSEAGYCPENCYWATSDVQTRNKGNNVWVTYQGERMCLGDAAARAGISARTVRGRMKKGWPEENWFEPPTPLKRRFA